LGLGVLTSVAPASAATINGGVEYITAIAASAASVPVAGNAGASVVTTVRFKTATTAEVHVQPAVSLISAPSTSVLASKQVYNATLTKGQWKFTTASAAAEAAADLTIATTDVDATGGTYNRSATGTALTFKATELHAWYDVAGSHKWSVWDDVNGSGTIDGSEFSYVYTVVVADGTAAITGTVKAFNSTSGAGSTNGSLVKISLKDAAGNSTNVDSAGGVKATVSGSAIITTASNTTASYIIPRTSFNGSGDAWINVTDATAEIVTVTLSGVGSTTISGNVPSLTHELITLNW